MCGRERAEIWAEMRVMVGWRLKRKGKFEKQRRTTSAQEQESTRAIRARIVHKLGKQESRAFGDYTTARAQCRGGRQMADVCLDVRTHVSLM
jgi:hypothetical protein